ncbi:hypothetical protein NQT62_01195 [Limnobacter humi]|uniref:Preprotein translocase subunit SecG n=1 Tax=Limnobacter humi TaxID=1778671 RepID=A0ABT1WC06_9BURK|nr:hypothetical protein [Limnobacter humi]MCQ8895050.1 hypothetical protein [Limnobacter humi]
MWKIIVGFIVFAAISMFVIIKGGDNLDMSGEKHDTGSHSEPAKPAEAPAAPADAAATPATPAVEPAPAVPPKQ